MAQLASSLQRAASPDSAALGGLKSEITEWRRCSAGDAKPMEINGVRHFSHDSQRPIPPVYGKFRAKTVSFYSLIAQSRRESLQPTYEQSSKTSGRRRERLADAHGSATPRPPDSMQPAATPPKCPSAAAKKTSNLRVAGRSRHRPSFLSHTLDRGPCQLYYVQHRRRRLDNACSASNVAASTTSFHRCSRI